MERVKTVMEILDKMNFFQGQRAGRELWNDKPFEVQEEDLGNFKRDIDTIGSYIWEIVKELKQYRDAEEQGLLLRLPCKIGRKVFYVQKCLAPSCKECKGFLRVDNCYCQYKARIFEQEFDYRHLKAFGKSVFLTKEEAEQALERMEKENG